jgi:phosphohistidine phosphatase
MQISGGDKRRFIFYEKFNFGLQNRVICCYSFRYKTAKKFIFRKILVRLQRFLQSTMKTLLILRHAKSSWDDADLADFDRPLNHRGLQTAQFIGNLMRERNLRVDFVLSSPAKRAKQTATLVKEAAGFAAEIGYDDRIYEASPISLLHILAEMGDEFDSLLLVGHNPGLEGLIKILTGGILSMPTAALAEINLKIDFWSSVEADTGKLSFVVRPKEEMESRGAR